MLGGSGIGGGTPLLVEPPDELLVDPPEELVEPPDELVEPPLEELLVDPPLEEPLVDPPEDELLLELPPLDDLGTLVETATGPAELPVAQALEDAPPQPHPEPYKDMRRAAAA